MSFENNLNSTVDSKEKLKQSAQELLNWNPSSALPQQSKVNILLAVQGMKPASEFSFVFKVPEREILRQSLKKEMEERNEETIKILKKLGLHIRVEFNQNGPFAVLQYIISKNQKYLDQLKEIEKLKPEKLPGEDHEVWRQRIEKTEYHYEQGKVFGYPETALLGWRNKNSIKIDDLPIEIRDSREGRFQKRIHLFALSKDHWQDELKVIENWTKALDEIVPGYIDNIPEDPE